MQRLLGTVLGVVCPFVVIKGAGFRPYGITAHLPGYAQIIRENRAAPAYLFPVGVNRVEISADHGNCGVGLPEGAANLRRLLWGDGAGLIGNVVVGLIADHLYAVQPQCLNPFQKGFRPLDTQIMRANTQLHKGLPVIGNYNELNGLSIIISQHIAQIHNQFISAYSQNGHIRAVSQPEPATVRDALASGSAENGASYFLRFFCIAKNGFPAVGNPFVIIPLYPRDPSAQSGWGPAEKWRSVFWRNWWGSTRSIF